VFTDKIRKSREGGGPREGGKGGRTPGVCLTREEGSRSEARKERKKESKRPYMLGREEARGMEKVFSPRCREVPYVLKLYCDKEAKKP